jgi:hypothetical protein
MPCRDQSNPDNGRQDDGTLIGAALRLHPHGARARATPAAPAAANPSTPPNRGTPTAPRPAGTQHTERATGHPQQEPEAEDDCYRRRRASLSRRRASISCLCIQGRITKHTTSTKIARPRRTTSNDHMPPNAASDHFLDHVNRNPTVPVDFAVSRVMVAPVQFAASAPNYDHPLRESSEAESLEQERPHEHLAASGRRARVLWGLSVGAGAYMTGTGPSGRFSRPLAMVARILRHPLRRPPAHTAGAWGAATCRRWGGGENPFGDPRFPSASLVIRDGASSPVWRSAAGYHGPAARSLRSGEDEADEGARRRAERNQGLAALRTSAHLNRRCPPTVRNDGSIPASAQRRTTFVDTPRASATSRVVSMSPSSYSGSWTGAGAARFALPLRTRFALVRRTRVRLRCSVAMRRRNAARISASSSGVNLTELRSPR